MNATNAGTGGSIDVAGLIATISSQPDPLAYLAHYLQEQRVPAQGPFFHIHAYTALGVHGCIILIVLLTTFTRCRRDQLWFTRRQHGRLRLNATVIATSFLAIYSSMAIVYIYLLLHQQKHRRYLAGAAAFQMSCFSAISFCISIIAFTYHQSLPVGFESSFFRTLLHKKHAAVDGHFFSFAFLCIWLVLSLAGLMTFPIIHDYWRRQIDSNIQGIITYLERDDVRERGLSALVGIVDQFSELPHQVEQAHLALQRQLLVYAAHCGLYLLIIVPVAIKLLSLLNKQMDALRRSADDYFRLDTRLKAAPRVHKMSTTKQPLLESIAGPGMTHEQDALALPRVAVVTCSNCSHDIPVNVGFEAPTTVQHVTLPSRKLPRYDANPDFPLHKLQRLKRVRVELAGFSAIIIIGLCNFLAWCFVAYSSIPHWSTAELTANLFAIVLWSYAVPAGISSIFYAYTTALLSRSSSNSSSTAASQQSGHTKSSSSNSRGLTFWQRLTRFKSRRGNSEWAEQYGQELSISRTNQAKHTQRPLSHEPPSGSPRNPLSPAVDTETLARAKEYDRPTYQSPVATMQWLEDQKRVASGADTLRVPPAALRSRLSMHSLRNVPRRVLPNSMTHSWLEIDED
ncbi:hypothetical protein P389DRAFT_187185 [Cystobasidium minutum MCA 4210]|uniref:uncharacterized protein n=1 Tax=Cystobasidium minutum MCA 4210 TaxID=1397322 RepID=UPI0034CDFB94|eukprot:jgi/Rhomi1/187185/estExt_fgenesh1_pg.C_1_t10469